MGYTPPQLEVRKITGGWQLYPPTLTTTDDLTISANGTDTYSKIKLNGNGIAEVSMPSGQAFQLNDATTAMLQMANVSAQTRVYIYCPIDGYDLNLKTTGTGVLRFGSYTAGAATDSTGYITIKDDAGNTRKLMVQA